MAYKPKSKRTNSPVGPQGKKLLDGLTANKNIDDIRALSKISNTQSTSISNLNTEINSANQRISQISTSKQDKLTLTTVGTSGPATLNNNTLNVPNYSTGLTVGSTPIAGGAVGRILFEGTGNVLQESANLFWDNTNIRLGIGVTPIRTLHVQHIGTSGVTGSLTFFNDNNSYTYLNIASNGLGIAVGSHSNGTGYISTSSSLNITNNNGTNPSVIWLGNGSRFRLNNPAETQTYLVVANSGNVLVNTTTDAGYKLDVNGTARSNRYYATDGISLSRISFEGFNNVSGIQYSNSGGLDAISFFLATGNYLTAVYNGDTVISPVRNTTDNYGDVVIQAGGSERARFKATGRVGIGTTTPSSIFDVVVSNGATSGLRFRGYSDASTPYLLSLGTYTYSDIFQITSVNGLVSLNNTGLYGLTVGTNNIERMRITSGGNMLINTTTDAGYKLDVNGTARFSGNVSLGSPNINDKLEVYGNILVRANDKIRLAGTSDGNTALYATGGAAAQINVKNGGASVFDVTFGTIGSTTRMLRVGSYDSNIAGFAIGVLIGVNATAVPSSVLTVESTTQGFLPPRMTNAQMLAIATPSEGLVVYDLTNRKLCCYDGSTWQNLF